MSRLVILVMSALMLISMLMPVAALAAPEGDDRVLLAQEETAEPAAAEEATEGEAAEESTAVVAPAPPVREGLTPADVALAETEFMRPGDGWILGYALVGFAAIAGIIVWGVMAQRSIAR